MIDAAATHDTRATSRSNCSDGQELIYHDATRSVADFREPSPPSRDLMIQDAPEAALGPGGSLRWSRGETSICSNPLMASSLAKMAENCIFGHRSQP